MTARRYPVVSVVIALLLVFTSLTMSALMLRVSDQQSTLDKIEKVLAVSEETGDVGEANQDALTCVIGLLLVPEDVRAEFTNDMLNGLCGLNGDELRKIREVVTPTTMPP